MQNPQLPDPIIAEDKKLLESNAKAVLKDAPAGILSWAPGGRGQQPRKELRIPLGVLKDVSVGTVPEYSLFNGALRQPPHFRCALEGLA